MILKRRSISVVSLLIVVVLLSGPFLFIQPVGASDPPIHIHLTWQNETNTTMTVTWQTSANTSGDVVLYDTVPRGGVPGLYSYSATGTNHTYSEASGYIHDVELTGLTPNTTYYFICGGATGGYSSERSFRTLPSTPSYIRFVVAGDSQSLSTETVAVTRALRTFNPSFVLHAGDHVLDGQKQSQWDDYFDHLDSDLIGSNNLTIPMITGIGNHDHGWFNKDFNFTKYRGQFALPSNEHWYSYDVGPDIHIIVLNSELHREEVNASMWDPQVAWLEADLAAHANATWKIVMFHRPTFNSMNQGGMDYPEGYIPGREDWVPLFDKYHVDIVFNGHNHNYMRSKPVNWTASNTTAQNSYGQGTMYVVTGGWGAWQAFNPVYYWWTHFIRAEPGSYSHHFVLVDIFENNTLHLQAKDEHGVTFDETWIFKDYSGPMAFFTYRPGYLVVNDTVTFDASSSESGDGIHSVPIVNYTWDFGDGNITTTSDLTITHEYPPVNNTYTVTLNITDNQGRWNTTSKTITMHLPVHDGAILSVTPRSSKHGPLGNPYTVTEGYSTWTIDVTVTVKNNGNVPETFTVQAFYGNATGNYTLGTKSATLGPGASTTKTFTWDLPDISKLYPYPTYTIYANVSVVAGETNTTDNFVVDGSVTVKWRADGNGDGKIGLPDLMILAMSYVPGTPDAPNYNPQADFSGDGPIGLPDLMILAMNYNNGPLDP